MVVLYETNVTYLTDMRDFFTEDRGLRLLDLGG